MPRQVSRSAASPQVVAGGELVGSGLFRCLCLGRSVCLLIRPDATPALDRDRQYMSSYIYHLAPGLHKIFLLCIFDETAHFPRDTT